MYACGLAGNLPSIANLIGERGEMAKQPLPDFLGSFEFQVSGIRTLKLET
jgi:hypothetical protein